MQYESWISKLRLAGPFFAVLLTLVMQDAPLFGQPTCICSADSPWGSCLINELQGDEYPGESPGSAVVVKREVEIVEEGKVIGVEVENWLFVADFVSGFTYRYDASRLDAPTVFVSPRGFATVTGIAYNPNNDRMYWAIDGRIVVTEVPPADADVFTDATIEILGEELPIEFDVDIEELATALFGSPSRAGTLGGLTYHTGRNTLWAVDIVNDVYFEMTLDGRLVGDSKGMPNHFQNPMRHPLGGGAFGNSITYTPSAEGEFFDIPAGSLLDGRPVAVLRVHAPTDPEASNVAFGADTGSRYLLVRGAFSTPGERLLVGADRADEAFPTGIAFWDNSCEEGDHSEFVLVDSAEGPDSVLEVSVDPATITNVANLQCQAGENNVVLLTWRATGGYRELQIFRRGLPDGGSAEEHLSTINLDGVPDPEQYVDATILPPADGVYEYRVQATGESGVKAVNVYCVVTIGRSTPVDAGEFTGGVDNSSRFPPTPFAVTHTGAHVYAVDLNTGVAQLFGLDDLAPAFNVRGPFSLEGQTTGIAYHPLEDRLYWTSKLEGAGIFIQSTDLEGRNLGDRLHVQFPVDLVRDPVLGDLSYDAARNQFWVTDVRNNIIFAVTPDGSYVADTIIENPLAGGILSGGLKVAEADEASVTLDIAVGPEDGIVDRLIRNRYELGNLSRPSEEYRLELAKVTGSAAVTGVDLVAEADQQILIGSDSRSVYRLSLAPAVVTGTPFDRGDTNNDGLRNISDPSFLLNWLFRGGSAPTCGDAADANDDGTIDISDAVTLFDYLFNAGQPPAPPHGGCGFDATASDLDCENSFCSEQQG